MDMQPARLLCPRDSPGKNTGVGCHALLQGIFPTQGSNLRPFKSPSLTGGFFTISATWEAPPRGRGGAQSEEGPKSRRREWDDPRARKGSLHSSLGSFSGPSSVFKMLSGARTWCSGKTWREGVEREVGGGIGMGKTCKLKDVSFQCMTKFTTN